MQIENITWVSWRCEIYHFMLRFPMSECSILVRDFKHVKMEFVSPSACVRFSVIYIITDEKMYCFQKAPFVHFLNVQIMKQVFFVTCENINFSPRKIIDISSIIIYSLFISYKASRCIMNNRKKKATDI